MNPRSPKPRAARAAPAAPMGAAALLERTDWRSSPLGPRGEWPAALRAAVDVALGSRFPMLVLWGAGLVQVYNDAMVPVLGRKHPAMGAPAAKCWAEVWDSVGPTVAGVMETGEAAWAEDARFLLDRSGFREETFFTVSYSPIRDDAAGVGGVFISALETTAHVLERRRGHTVSRVVSAAASARGPDEVLELAVASAVDEDLAWIAAYLLEPGAVSLTLAASAGLGAGGLRAGAAPDPREAAVARALSTGRASEIAPEALARIAPGAEGRAVAVRIPGADGCAGVLVAGLSPHLTMDEAYAAFVGRVARGVGTALERAGRIARAESERLAVLERMTDAFFALDHEWRFTSVNPVVERMTRRAAADLIGQGIWEVLPSLKGTPFEAAYRAAMSEQAPRQVTALSPVDGEWIDAQVYPSPGGISVFAHSAGERVRIEALRAELLERERVARADAEAAERRLRDLVEGLDAVVWEAESHPARFTFVSEQARALLGHPPERWLDEPGFLPSILHPEDRGWVLELSAAAAAAGRDHALEYRVRAADGRTVWVRDTVRVTGVVDGRVRLRGVMVDVTVRRRADDEARRLAAIVEATEDAVVAKALDGTILSWNAGAERTFGWREDEVVGRTIFELIDPARHDEERAILARVAAGERVSRYETERPARGGGRVVVSLTVSPIFDAGGGVQCAAVILRDVTDERRLQAQLRQAQKMEAVGRLAGGVAHDFNNLLTVIRGNAAFLVDDLPPSSPLREEVEEIERASQRASDLTRQLLAFSQRQVLQPRVVDLNAAVVEMKRMLRRLIEEDVAIEVTIAPGAARVTADPGQVEQVVLNLAVNARDAMPHGGTLGISTSAASVPPEPREGWPYYVPAGDYVRLEVSDTGVGMETQVLQHLFEPFFTTKPAGTGLGLSTVYGIVKQSGGYVWAETEPGAGSRFVVLLPPARDDVQAAPAGLEAGPGSAGGATVLLVEDEESVRSLARRVLGRAGYRVLEAGGGRQALEVAAAHEGDIELLLTDVVMPGGGGPRLAEAMARVRPSTRVLFMSGYPGDSITHHGLPLDVDLLAKPFTPAALLHRVADALAGRCGTPRA
ncbi:MAG TPA: PAS domain S-box protein [Longimicrobium sp.]|nr:PAS domain S-box protein [Longimicrobium sp.]